MDMSRIFPQCSDDTDYSRRSAGADVFLREQPDEEEDEEEEDDPKEDNDNDDSDDGYSE